jgi:hypothetical protein
MTFHSVAKKTTKQYSLLQYFKSIVRSDDCLAAMLEQSERTTKKFLLKGIEHVYKEDNKHSYCTHCGYGLSNLMHVSEEQAAGN